MSGGFQTQVNDQPAPAVEGDFASTNPIFGYDAGPGGLVAGPAGATVGRFAWVTQPNDANGAAAIVNSSGTGQVAGFLNRAQQALITLYLADASMIVPQGFQVSLQIGGDFWVKNNGATQALPGQKAYAAFADGRVNFAATGSPTTGGSGSTSSIAASTSSFTGSITDAIMTVTGSVTGTIYPGTTISGTSVATGTQITRQLTSTAALGALGSTGTYAVSIPEQTVAATTISGTYGTLTVAGTVAGTFAVNNVITGTSVVAGTTITALGNGTGGAGTYIVNNNTVVTSTSISVAAVNVETKWFARSSGLPGELVKISNYPLG